MGNRITKKILEQQVARLNSHHVFKATTRYEIGDRFELQAIGYGYRLTMRHASTAETDVSPCGTASELHNFINGMATAFDYAAGY